jgi:perosamine synthetase
VSLPVRSTSYADNIYWIYPLVLKPEAKMNAAQAMKVLSDRGVGVRPFFYPMHKQPALIKRGFAGETCPEAEYLAEYGFYIPSGLGLTSEEQQYVADVVCEIFG